LDSFDTTSRDDDSAKDLVVDVLVGKTTMVPALPISLLLPPLPRLRVGCLPVEEQLPLGPGGVRALAARLASAGPATGVLESERVKGTPV